MRTGQLRQGTHMSQTTTDGSQQDAWISRLTGLAVDRAAANQARLDEIDTALTRFTDVVATVSAPQPRAVLDKVGAELARRRSALAPDGAAALLQDIAKATTAAERAASQAAQPAPQPEPPQPGPQAAPQATPQEGPQAGPVADFFTGIGHAIADGVTTAVETIGQVASVVVHKITQRPAADCLNTFQRWPPVFKRIKEDNPVGRAHAALTQRLKAADAMSGLAKQVELDSIADAATLADTSAKQAFEANLIVQQNFAAVERNLADLALPDPQKGAVRDQLTKLKGDYDNAMTTAASVPDFLSALNKLKTESLSVQAQSISVADATTRVRDELAQAKTAIDKLKDAGQKSGLTKQYDALTAQLADSGKIADIGTQKRALFDLGKSAVALLGSATKAQFTEQAATPEGKKQIDAMIGGLPDISHDPAQQEICKSAIAACYKVPLAIPEGMEMSRLPGLYKMMTQIPAADLGGLKGIEYESDPTIGSSYYFKEKIVLTELGREGGLQTMEDQANRANDKSVDYFKMTALHELGHYVDDKYKVMDSARGNAAFGDWQDSSPAQAAEALYKRSLTGFVGTGKKPAKEDLVALLVALLSTGKAAKPADAAAKLGSLFDDWDAILANTACTDALKMSDATTYPWNNMVAAGDGRAYHGGNGGRWYSYPVAERGKGISNYQFRAPPEWFAEQFAYYRMFPGKTPPAAIARYMTAT